MNAIADVGAARAALVEKLQHALDALEQGDEAGWRQELDAIADLAEIPLLGLRMHRGVDWEDIRARAAMLDLRHIVDAWEVALGPFLEHGLLEQEGPILRFTNRGMLLSNVVLETFV